MDPRERKGSQSGSQSGEASRKRKSEGKTATKPTPSKLIRSACFGSSDSSDSSEQEDEPMETDKRFSKYSSWLLSNVEGLTEPSSLFSKGGKSLADWCNTNLTLPVRDLPSQMQASTCPLLTPRLFVLHLKRYGGLLGLKRRMYLDDFQPVLQRLFDLSYSLHKVPFCLHRYIRAERNSYLRRLKKRRKTDHAFNRLNLNHCQQLVSADKTFKKRPVSQENKNAKLGIDFSRMCLQLYKMSNSTMKFFLDTKVFVKLGDPIFEMVNSNWTNLTQYRFGLSNIFPDGPKPKLQKIAYDPAPFCRQLLVCISVARERGKYPAAIYLCARLLSDPVFSNNNDLKIFRVYAWCFLAKSLAHFYVRLDLVLAFLDRALSAVAYPTDKLLVYNAKQHVLLLYGCHLAERDLFEHICNEGLAPRNSNLFYAVCVKHIASVIRQNEDNILECFCLVADLSRVSRPSIAKALKKKLRQVKNRSAALTQLIKNKQFLNQRLTYAVALLSVHKTLALMLEDRKKEAFKLLRKTLGFSDVGGTLYFLLHTFMTRGAVQQASFEKYQRDLQIDCELKESDGDWKEHVAVADTCYEKLACLLASGLAQEQPQHALDLVQLTTKIYESVSANLTHHRLPLLKKVRAVLLKEEPLTPTPVFPGLCAKQKKANLRICHELGERASSDFLNSLNDPALLDYYMFRDAHYLKTIFTLGKMSVQRFSGV